MGPRKRGKMASRASRLGTAASATIFALGIEGVGLRSKEDPGPVDLVEGGEKGIQPGIGAHQGHEETRREAIEGTRMAYLSGGQAAL